MNVPMKRQDGSFPLSILGDFDKAFDQLGTLFDETLRNYGYSTVSRSASFAPPIEVAKNKEGYQVSIECPGIKKEDINVSLDGNRLVIEGKKESWVSENDEWEVVVQERFYGMFHRELALPDGVDKESIVVSLDNGVLTINLALLQKEDTRRKLEIK